MNKQRYEYIKQWKASHISICTTITPKLKRELSRYVERKDTTIAEVMRDLVADFVRNMK